ncbi:MAG: TonB family protein [Bacteroidota bacterium]
MLNRGQEDKQITSYLEELEKKEQKKALFIFSGIGVGVVVLSISIFLLVTSSQSSEDKGPLVASEYAEGDLEEKFASQYEVFNNGTYFAEGVIIDEYNTEQTGEEEDFLAEDFSEDFGADEFLFEDGDDIVEASIEEVDETPISSVPVSSIQKKPPVSRPSPNLSGKSTQIKEETVVKKESAKELIETVEAVEEKPPVILPESSSPSLSQIQERGDKKEKRRLSSAEKISAPIIKKRTDLVTGPDIAEVADNMPSFPGGAGAMYRFLRDNLDYPASALNQQVEGQVLVQIIVNEQGEVTQPRILKSLGEGCDEEALRLISKMPDWIPGSKQGKAVKVRRNVPVTFILPK